MTFRLRTTGGYARPLPQPAVFEQPCSLLPIVAPVSSAPKALVAPWALTMLRLRREVQPALREAHGSFIADSICNKVPVPELPLDGMRIVSGLRATRSSRQTAGPLRAPTGLETTNRSAEVRADSVSRSAWALG